MNPHIHLAASQGLRIFLSGCSGSLAVEVIGLYSLYLKANFELPKRYRRVGFYFIRFVLMVLAGGLALAYEVDKPLLAMNIGAADPLLIQHFANGVCKPNRQG